MRSPARPQRSNSPYDLAPPKRQDAEWISERVRQIIDAKKKLQAMTLGQHKRERLERQVEAHEAAIDELVYKLYGLSDEDTPVIEEGTVR